MEYHLWLFVCRFKVTVIAADDTGGLEIILNDREVRALINKMVEELESKVI